MKTTSGKLRSVIYLAIAAVIGSASAQASVNQRWQAQAMGGVSAEELSQRIGLEVGSRLEDVRSAPTVHGTETVRMRQTWLGVPVYGRGATVERDADGRVVTLSGLIEKQFAPDMPSALPRLSATQAQAAWRGQSGTNLAAGMVEDRDAELFVYPHDGGKARLVYLVSHYVSGEKPSRPTAILDADTGQIIDQWEGLANAEATGPGGNAKTGRYEYGVDFPALQVTQAGAYCTTENANVGTFNMANRTSGPGTLWRFLCPNSAGDDVNQGYGPINDAHYFGGVVFDMYRSYLATTPLRQKLVLRVHYGTRYENAFWDGSAMTFGDGDRTFYPLVGLDVVAHEVSHGFTEQNSGLVYTNQSGGMNEAFSDIAGEAAEWFSRGRNDLLVGAEIFKSGGGALRYMCEPPRDGVSIGHARDYRAGMPVHYSSGVYNKAFCTLAKTGGWDAEKAFKVFARANMLYWRSNETFDGGACGVQRSAADIGLREADVVAAFGQVGVTCR
jgi:vibriolysin